MNYKQSLIETICKHPAVSRAMSGKDQGPAVEKLVTLRKARRNAKRQRANFREELRAGTNPEAMASPNPSWPGVRLIREALEIGGLPEDLTALCEQAIAE